MTNRLVLLVGEFANSDHHIDHALREWSAAGLLGTVAWTSITESPRQRPIAVLSEESSIRDIDLFELLTSSISCGSEGIQFRNSECRQICSRSPNVESG